MLYLSVQPFSPIQGTATRDDIDKTFRLGMNHPMGPLQLGKLQWPMYDSSNLVSFSADL